MIKRQRTLHCLFAMLLAVAGGSVSVLADEPAAPAQISPEDLTFFESKVRPLLVEHCLKCHGAAKQKGGLRLDSREAILAGGESGAAMIPADSVGSLLLQAVRYESNEMPPTGKLPDDSIAVLEEWIHRGAPWPEVSGMLVTLRPAEQSFTDEDRAWWAIQPLQDYAPPQADDDTWSRNDIDRFVRSQMLREGLEPAPEADRATLIRRLSFDLTGLPPSPLEVYEFEIDADAAAYENLVERLLQSPRYGERWARQWLDVVRYAESDGYRIDHYRPDAWRYRDYVIQSFNSDKAYDRFVQEQLAGDELFPDNPDPLIATGYLRHWIYEYNNRDVRGQWDTILNEITDTTGDVFLGVGLQCARCHDHKFDPILQKDYFRLQAYFAAMIPSDRHVIASTAEIAGHDEKQAAWETATAEIRARIATLEQPFRDRARLDAISKFPPEVQHLLTGPAEQRSSLERQLFELAFRQVDYEYDGLDAKIKGDEKEQLLALRRELLQHDALKPNSLPTALVVTDVSTDPPLTVMPKKKTVVSPGILSILNPADAEIAAVALHQKTTGRRAALAKWLTQPDNPLSTRVIVNRIWQAHFGRGLAQNASDFGTLGGPPSHPELLDWLTLHFVRGEWKLKELHRLIVKSATYRQSSEHPKMAEFQLADPTNRNYWKFSMRRLDAEQIRDSILLVSGQLDLKAGGAGVQSDVPRRSVYLRVMRNERDPLLDVFDLPQFFTSASSRDTTTSPVQSLLLFNSQMMMNHAAKFAVSLESGAVPAALPEAVSQLWQRAFGRVPGADELLSAEQFLAEQRDRIVEERGQSDLATVPVGRLPYRDGQAIVVTPDDRPLRMATEFSDGLNPEEFTIETCFQIRSVQDTAAVRTLVARWNGDAKTAGWSFGVTGKASRRKPQTLVIQLFGRSSGGEIVEAALFSDQRIELDTPYFAAVSMKPASSGEDSGTVVFYLKNLSNDDELLNSVTVSHSIVGGVNAQPLTIGFRQGSKENGFDGVIDDVRLSASALNPEQLLLTSESAAATTIGYWRFEPVPGLLEDSTKNSHRLRLMRTDSAPLSPEQTALADLCHLVLNSNEFLYVK